MHQKLQVAPINEKIRELFSEIDGTGTHTEDLNRPLIGLIGGFHVQKLEKREIIKDIKQSSEKDMMDCGVTKNITGNRVKWKDKKKIKLIKLTPNRDGKVR